MTEKKNKRWIFPEFPESEEVLPEIVIELATPSYEAVSAGNNLKREQVSSSIYKEYYYKKATSSITFNIITSKEFSAKVTNVDGDGEREELFLKNRMPNIFLFERLKNLINSQRELFFEILENINITDTEMTFENDSKTWASTMTCEIEWKDIWVNTYVDTGLISSYSLGITDINSDEYLVQTTSS